MQDNSLYTFTPPQPLKTAVLFLVFNRLDTTKQVFEAIRLARPPRLYIAADGPRDSRPGEDEKVKAVRDYVMGHIDWDCEVKTLFREKNLGCKYAVSGGIDWFFENEEMGIILEDDCLPDKSFFGFCEKMLRCYRDDVRVMMVGGTNYLLDQLDIRESYCFSRYFAIWGWATWRRSWQKYDITMKDWEVFKEEEQVKSFYAQRFMQKYVASMFDAAHRCQINTWDIQWFYSCLLNNGVSIVPKVNLISNLGLVGTHTSTDTSNNLKPVFELDVVNIVHPDLVYPNYCYDNVFFKKKLKVALSLKIRKMLSKLLLLRQLNI